ncbi:MAG TPA: FAD-dependent oxidoreductase [Anaerolineae bacterium]|nr:FAD-dependent oxidoreductase [Anaerolineae bacterium]
MAGDNGAPVGAVLVVGGGIGGMQASIDLAEAGFKVYLVEEKPAIGGVMAQLDKTFPTNDCAMCIMSPKLVECGRHLNIEIITGAELKDLVGEPGHFTAVVEQKPRFVDMLKCTACGDCAGACPVSLADLFNAGLATRHAAYKLYPQATPNAYAVEKRGTAPCREACPIHQRAQGYVALVRERRWADAYRTIKEDNPFPGICGRICKHFCEDQCSRGRADSAVSIMALKRFVADRARSEGVPPVERVAPQHEERVAIIGAGPAGLTAAQDLALAGYPVTVFEALPVAGGMLRVGVPEHRLPREVIAQEVADIVALGVDLRLNSRVTSLQALVDEGYRAVFIATGAHGGRKLPIPGADEPDCWLATEFLRRVALGERPDLSGRHVVVLGGGPVAIDVAQTAVRLGAAEVQMACLESLAQMPASPEEVQEAEEEGIAVHPSRTFLAVATEDGRVRGVRCAAVDFRGFLPGGRPDMDIIADSEHLLAGDLVIFAIGQAPELDFLPQDGPLAVQGRRLVVDPETLESPLSRTLFPSPSAVDKAIASPSPSEGEGGGEGETPSGKPIEPSGEPLPADRQARHEAGFPLTLTLSPAGEREQARPAGEREQARPAGEREQARPAGEREQARPAGEREQARPAGERGQARPPSSNPPPWGGRWGVGVFGGGDAVVGAGSAVEAIAAGHKAGRSIQRYLRQDPAAAPEPLREPVVALSDAEVAAKLAASPARKRPRAVPERVAAALRRQDFREMTQALSEEAAVAEAERCLSCGVCSECLACQYACQPKAINHQMTGERRELAVGAVLLAPGAELFDPHLREEYGYGRYPNVVTSIEFERILSASGPFGGQVQRPSDGREPRRIAWLQCVGSRDVACGRPYCSSVCCMYAVKEAVIAKEHVGEVEATVFYLDVRAFGKDFERYIERAKHEHGVRFVRSFVSSLKEDPKTHDIVVRYGATPSYPTSGGDGGLRPEGLARRGGAGGVREEAFDLVVLSVGLQPGQSARELAARLGLQPDAHGFPAAPPLAPAATVRPGIYAIGTFREPKDIPETVIEASCAAAQASALLAPSRGTLTRVKAYPPERDIRDEEERVGVFVCHCGINIGGTVDVPAVVEYVRTLPGVAYAEHNLYTCSQDTQAKIRATIEEHRLNRVVVASCTPRTHEPLFQDTIREAGLNRFLFEMTNLREQASWVHRHDPQAATEKAKQLVAMAVAKARLLKPISRPRLTVEPSVLVVGGGAAGMTAALAVAEQGYGVHLVERTAELGGHLRHIRRRLVGGDPQELLQSLAARVAAHPRITVHTQAEVAEVAGYVGKFDTTLRLASGEETHVAHGAVIVATGGNAVQPREYLYGQDPRVLTQTELEERLAAGQVGARRVVMIQCAGSRDDERPYCSRFCCGQALKNAIAIKEAQPEAEVVVLYRDIRAYGFRELHYRRARELGVLFFPYEPDNKPRVTCDNTQHATRNTGDASRITHHASAPLRVEADTPDGTLTWQLDLLVLSTGVEPGDNRALAQMLKVPLTEDGFFLEAHVKLRPLEFAADGVFLCGLAHSPREVEEAMAQAYGAAVRAVALLSKGELEAAGITATVNERTCAGCGVCVSACPYGARQLDEEARVARVIDVLCQGCGACCVACPSGASQQKGFEKRMEFAKIDAALT